MAKLNMKRIHKVVIKHLADTDPDTSYLGEYGDSATSEFSIDRAHSLECRSIDHTRDSYTYTHDYELRDNGQQECRYCDVDFADSKTAPCPDHNWEDDCDCSGGDMQRGQFRYFNPSSIEPFDAQAIWIPKDIADKKAHWLKTMKENAKQDYARMESLNAGNWCYIGIRAQAEILLAKTGPFQTITSGGLWGTESDSDRDYLDSIGKEELSDLSTQLQALGFSKRAIASAFKNVTEVSE